MRQYSLKEISDHIRENPMIDELNEVEGLFEEDRGFESFVNAQLIAANIASGGNLDPRFLVTGSLVIGYRLRKMVEGSNDPFAI